MFTFETLKKILCNLLKTNMYVTNNLTIRDNVWNHMAVTVDVANSNINFYLNNSNVFTQSNVDLTINSNLNSNLYLAFAEAESNSFKGVIDQVQLFDKAVSSYQMNDLATFPVLNLDMTPTDTNLVIDTSSFQNTVTMSNSPVFTDYGYQPNNKALVFDVTQNQALVVSSSNIQNANAKQMTLSMWVKPMEYILAPTVDTSTKYLITNNLGTPSAYPSVSTYDTNTVSIVNITDSDVNGNLSNLFNGNNIGQTSFSSSSIYYNNNSIPHIIIDLGDTFQLTDFKIWDMRRDWTFTNVTLETSSDNVTYENLTTFTHTPTTNWNSGTASSTFVNLTHTGTTRYVKAIISSTTAVYHQENNIGISGIEIYGYPVGSSGSLASPLITKDDLFKFSLDADNKPVLSIDVI